MPNSKVESYLGFCKRAGKLTLGVNAVATLKKEVYLLVMDSATAVNSRKEIAKLHKKFACPLVMAEGLETLVGKANCKLAAVRERSLAEAILREAGKQPISEIIGGLDK